MVTLYSLSAPFMRLIRPFYRTTRPFRRLTGFWLSLVAVLTILSTPAHALMGAQQARAVTLCTAQGMMTVWIDKTNDPTDGNFTDLKLKASQQCFACLAHLPNIAPPNQTPSLSLAHARYQLPIEHDNPFHAPPRWRWVSPRAPPA